MLWGEEKVGILSSNSGLLLEKSMGYLWTKQAAILDNIANAETPNYKEKVVTFEESLRSRLQKAAGASRTPSRTAKAARKILDAATVSVTEQQVATRMDENGVNVTVQSAEAVRNAYQLRYVMSAINSDLSLLRSAVRGQ